MNSSQLIDQAFAASLAAGSVATLGYGYKILSFPIQIAATTISTSIFPYFSALLAQDSWPSIKRLFSQYLRLILIFTIPLTALLIAFSEPLVSLLLERGSFTADDTVVVARVQAFGAMQIPFYLSGVFVLRLLNALKANRSIMFIAFIIMIVNVVADYLLMKMYGVVGIALSTSIVSFIYFILLFINVTRILSHKNSKRI